MFFDFLRRKRIVTLGGANPDPILGGLPWLKFGGMLPESMPRSFSLRNLMPKAGIQKNYDCVGWAGAYLREYQETVETGQYEDYSGMGVYAMAKQIDGLSEKGTWLHMATYVPMKFGTVLESDYPEIHVPADPVMPEISRSAMDRAAKRKTKDSVAVEVGDMHQGIRRALVERRAPVVIGMYWRKYAQVEKDGTLMMSGPIVFGHALTATGFDDDRGAIEVLDSKGREWGDEGYAWIPYSTPLYAQGWISADLPNEEKEVEKVPTIEKPRNLQSEQRNAIMLREAIYRAFAATDRARALAAKDWFRLVNAATYLGYSFTDLVNDLYSRSRNRGPIFDLAVHRVNR